MVDESPAGHLRSVAPPAKSGSVWRRRATLLVFTIVTIAVAIAGYRWYGRPNAAPEYVTAAVERGNIVVAVISSGTVNPVTTIQVGTYVSGVIQSIACDFNTRVRSGQLCATIDPRPYQVVVTQETANLGMAQAQLERDRAALAYAKLIYQRNADLLQRGIVSQETVDTAKNAYDLATAQIAVDTAAVAQGTARLEAARINLGYTRIVSPVDGTVVSRNVTQGQTVAASFQTPTLFLIATDLTHMQVDTNVSESDIGRIAVGNPAMFTVESYSDRQFSGVVQQVRQAPQMVQNVVTYDVVVSVANTELLLRPGMTASMRIVTNQADHVLRVPVAALRYNPSRAPRATEGTAALNEGHRGERAAQLWALKDGRALRIPVVVGLDDDAYAEIVSGELREGQPVIVAERTNVASRASAGGSGPRMPRM